ncbi:MAG: type II toxin-antitoxin system death-on-curing family toxin [Alphaproteobacteria bacterium]|nr:MAG: type II toxin-antitoxin system death-on-curing family toxin [Alphaproteobacteria bacterium]
MSERRRPIDHLTTEDLLEIAAGVVKDVQVRDVGLLASAAARPRTTVFGHEAYPTLADQAAALMHSLARNHPLLDGNKRLAWSATRIFCLLNDSDLVMDVDEAEQMVLAVAAGALDAAALADTIRNHLR